MNITKELKTSFIEFLDGVYTYGVNNIRDAEQDAVEDWLQDLLNCSQLKNRLNSNDDETIPLTDEDAKIIYNLIEIYFFEVIRNDEYIDNPFWAYSLLSMWNELKNKYSA
jgi:hypothetical protein